MADNKKIAQNVLEAVGGAGNVQFVTHCMTRLRFNVKDKSKIDDARIKKIAGVIGAQESGGQYQVIVGQNVPKVYDELCRLGGIAKQAAIDEDLDPNLPKEKLTPKRVGKLVLDYLSGTFIPFIPVMMAASLFRMLGQLLGPSMLNVIAADSSLMTVCNAVYNGGFYFMPIFLGFSAAKKIGLNAMMGALMGAILIAPDLLAVVGEPFDVYGIPTTIYSYTTSALPIVLSVPVMYLVNKLVNRYLPDTLRATFEPLITVAIMLPLSLCVLAPLGNYCSQGLVGIFVFINQYGGIPAMCLVAALWEFLVMTGMHTAINPITMTMFTETGHLSGVLIASCFATYAAWGMALGATFRAKSGAERALNFGYFVSGFLGGVTEPVLYGLGVRYRKPFIGMIAGAIAGAIVAGATNATAYVMWSSNILGITRFGGGSTENLVSGIIACAVALVVSAVVTFIVGYDEPVDEDEALDLA